MGATRSARSRTATASTTTSGPSWGREDLAYQVQHFSHRHCRLVTNGDALAARTLVKGEPLAPPAGRADDFVWPRREVGREQVKSEPAVASTRALKRTRVRHHLQALSSRFPTN